MGTILDYIRDHRKAVLSLLVLLSVIVLFFIASSRKKQVITQRGTFTIADSTAREGELKKLQQDSDGDGLRDWEETIYRTDPYNPDTDGDGTPDGEEVRQGRDPLKANTAKPGAEPNDLIATSTPLQESAGQDENLTRALAVEFGKQMIARRIANPDVPFNSEAIAQDLVGGVVGSASNAIQYSLTKKDIVIGSDDSKEAVQRYRKEASHIILGGFQYLTKDEVIIFSEVLASQDYEQIKKLDPYISAYGSVIPQLKKLPVPPQIAPLHLEYLNLAIAEESAVRKMRATQGDPISAIIGARQYIEIQKQFIPLLKRFASAYQKAEGL